LPFAAGWIAVARGIGREHRSRTAASGSAPGGSKEGLEGAGKGPEG